jgi:hypothetical protein
MKQFTDEHKKNMSLKSKDKNKGIKKSEEHKRKISQSHFGIKQTDQAKEKLSKHFAKKWT